MTIHIEAKKEDIAKTVIMPGDPLRAKYIAQKYLTDYKLINSVRNILGYTGYFNNKRVTVFASGMGIPSIGIYAYELYTYYDVETIIRVGSCGSFTSELKLLDTVLVDNSYSDSNFNLLFAKDESKLLPSSVDLTNELEIIANTIKVDVKRCNIVTSDCFDHYIDWETFYNNIPKEYNVKCAEMEAFGLFSLAKHLNKSSACLLTVVDSHKDLNIVSSIDRQTSLDNMILIALNAVK
ncbi:MAG: purine-nucleoside phosphorylase [Bacilli bacterium]